MSFAQEKLYLKLVSALFLIAAVVTVGLAQRKKTPVKPAAKQTSKNQPLVKKTASVKESKSKTNSKISSKMSRAEERRLAEIRREAEEARRRAALEIQRRREQAIREARARKAAFENGLRSTTVDNIL